MSKIFVIGAANIDVVGKSEKSIIENDSNPAKISFNFGGVGRNIAENISNLNETPYFVSVFSNDFLGNALYEDCINKGFDLNYSLRSDKQSSAYMAILNQDNELQVGLCDAELVDELTSDNIDSLNNIINEDDYVIIDTNLNEVFINYAFKHLKGHLVSDGISTTKVMRLTNVLNYIDILKVNKLEAEALLSCKLDNEKDYIKGLNDLRKMGIKNVLLTISKGVYLANADGIKLYLHDQFNKNVVNVTGAGDAFLANYLVYIKANYDIDEAIKLALSASNITVKSNNTVAKYSLCDVSKNKKKMTFEVITY